MEITDKLLRKLALLTETDRAVLSVYLNTAQHKDKVDEYIEKAARRLRPLLSTEERSNLDDSLEFLVDFINGKRGGGYRGPGLAFFADLGASYVKGVELPVTPDPLLTIESEPRLFPLAMLLDEYEPVGVITVDHAGARIFVAAGKTAEDGDSLKKKIKNLVKVGGWSQMRYQRRRDKQILHMAKDVAERARKLFGEAGVKRIVLAGRKQMIDAVKPELPKALAEQIIGTVAWDMKSGEDKLLEKLRPVMEQAERDQEAGLLERLNGELRRNGLAVGGLKLVQDALQFGAVDTLLVSDDLDQDSKERFTRQAEAINAHVEFFPGKPKLLAEHEGIAALLRYRAGF
ncbi:hypothetical protein K8R78_00335 [bacterium]|nr:hypothetical protein [bacterium]